MGSLVKAFSAVSERKAQSIFAPTARDCSTGRNENGDWSTNGRMEKWHRGEDTDDGDNE